MSTAAHDTSPASAEDLARFFHTTYERLAPHFGYETREASRTDWANVPEQNKELMIAVAREVLAFVAAPACDPAPGARDVAGGGTDSGTDSGAEGGQLDPPDDLLAEADAWRGSLLSEDLVSRLASALRSWRAAYEVIWGELAEAAAATAEVYDKWVRADRQLAEARSHGEVLYRGPVHAFRYDCPPGTEVLVVLAPTETDR